MIIVRLGLVLLAGCWVTPVEVDNKIEELADDETAADTGLPADD